MGKLLKAKIPNILLHFFILETAFSQSNPITLKDGTEFYKLGLHLDILEQQIDNFFRLN